jgi:hypothetical protein
MLDHLQSLRNVKRSPQQPTGSSSGAADSTLLKGKEGTKAAVDNINRTARDSNDPPPEEEIDEELLLQGTVCMCCAVLSALSHLIVQ